ncbi:hypothetical protein [Spiroplasma culicicola]|uniref:Uncharacterized protein n=1 Tax=Spiroplasma culicicola AES-1 TaxID=1276246 RepID=W6A7N7_9MOLU|nr:hypothetical protein [Spiroplasma culicicola]AHI53001.1 hypothetical protein SCULI_v1c06600 [Spiroplasma culicicola AES-1]
MVKLLSLIGSLTFGATNVIPIVVNTNNILKINEQETIDMALLNNYWETQHLGYDAFAVSSYSQYIIPAMVRSVFEKEHGITIEENWVQLESMINVIDGRAINDDDIRGTNGASKETWITKVIPTEAGIENGLYGASYINVTIHHQAGDLSTYDKTTWIYTESIVNPTILVNLHSEIMSQFLDQMHKSNVGNALYFINGIDYSNFYIFDSAINRDRLATQEDLDNANNGNGQITLSVFLSPNQIGKSKGIYGSAYITFNLNLR